MAAIMGVQEGSPPNNSENSSFCRIIDNRLTCRNYSKNRSEKEFKNLRGVIAKFSAPFART